ncbi:MAG: two-component regulator propeller domain-containing protein, partial [Balneolaceae bacterium]|nr:two-component regulator propeller domain-containing protein [Balneolaceae bacterium]
MPGFTESIEQFYPNRYSDVSKQVFGVKKIPGNKAWVLTRKAGLLLYDIPSGGIERHPINPPEITFNWNDAFALDSGRNGELYLLYINGVAVTNSTDRLQRFIPLSRFFEDFNTRQQLPVVEELNVLRYHADYFWIGSTEHGLAAYNPETGQSLQFRYDQGDYRSISSNHILSISPDPRQPQQFVWIGTNGGGGVNRINLNDQSVRRFTEAQGLPNNIIYAIYPDRSGYLWMSSNRGIIR